MDDSLSTGQILLRNRSDWPYWIAQLELHARDKAVWDQIDPNGETVPPIDEQEPEYPEPTEQMNTPESDISEVGTTSNPQLSMEKLINSHSEKVRRYKVATSKWARTASKLSNIRDWINRTVAADLMAPASIKLLNLKESTPQALVRILKNDLAPTNSNTMALVRQQYQSHLDKARLGRLGPEKWFSDWQVLYRKA